jgi:hypothetical protein
MDWPWIEEALDEKEKTTEPEPEEMSDALNPEPDFDLDPAREGIDWVLDGRGHPVHPTAKRAHEALHRLLDELRAAGLFPESRDEPLENFVGLFMTLSAKLAGAFSSIVHSHGSPDAGLSIAFLKRALKVLNETIAAADAERLRESLSFERVAHYRDELFKVREEILAVIARLRA